MRFIYKCTNYFKIKLFVPCKKLKMKNFVILIAVILTFISCNSNDGDEYDLLPNIPVNQTIFLNNPEYINLQVVGGWAYTQGGVSGIIVYHYGTNSYVAFERSAPHLTPEACSRMTVENGIIMFCKCDNSEFSILDGSPQTDDLKYAARQYRVDVIGNQTLQITNF